MTNASNNTPPAFDPHLSSEPSEVINLILDSLTKGVAVVGSDYRVLAFNRIFEEFSQLPPGTFEVGADFRTILSAWAEVTGQDRHIRDRAILKLDDAAPFEFEFPQQIKGERRWYLLTHNPSPGRGFVRTLTDITVRKMAEEALRKSENDYRTLIHNLATGVVVHGPDTSILVSNLMASSILGLTEDQFRGKAAIDPEWRFLQEDGSPMPLEQYPVNRVIAAGEVFHGQVIGMHRIDRAEPTWVLCSGYPVKDAEGKLLQAVITFSDVTELKQSKAKLRASEESLAITLHSIGDAVIATDVVGRITRMNPTAERLTGWSLTEALGQPMVEVFHIINAQTRVPVQDPVQAVLAHGQVIGLANHTVLLARDGQEYQVADSAAPIRDAAGQVMGVVLVVSDVTEKYRLEENLSRTTDLLKNASELAKVGGWELELPSMELTWSPGTYHLHELDPHSPVDVASGIRFYAPEAQPIIAGAVQAAIEDGTPYDLELPLVTAKGRVFWARAQCHPIVENGRVTRLLGAFQDVTERKQSEARFKAMFEASPIPFALNSAEGAISFLNPAFTEVFGYTIRDIPDLESWWQQAYPDPGYRAWVLSAWAERMARLEQGSVEFEPLEVMVRCKDGADRSVIATSVELKGVHGATHLVALYDITERKGNEEALRETSQRLHLATESAYLAVWDWDLQGGTMTWDDRMFELYGTTRLETQGTVQDWMDGLHPEDLQGAVRECEAAIRGEAPFDTEFRVRHRDGTVRWIKANATVLRDQEGHPVRMVGVNRDVSDFHQAEEEKSRLQAQLVQSQKLESLGTLAGGLAHDMNNVLGAILGLASAHLPNQPVGSPLHRALETICKATERGGKVVKSLLSFARQSPAENDKLDMNAILREQVALLERTTLARVRLEVDLEVNLRPILGDSGAITHAFMNLCVNAVDAMPENGTLTLRTRNVDNDWIEVVVEDDGTGMSKEVLEKATEPFYTTKETGKGTGLGLSMVFSTVKAHRGHLAIESEPGKGTRVRLRFPACEQATTALAGTLVESQGMQPPQGSLRVLLVDDDDLVQGSVQAVLECLGHTRVIIASSGEEALVLLEAGLEADLIILDMNMPGLGGIGTLPRLRGLRPLLPILLATGRVDQTAVALASSYPGVTLLSKPFGLRDLQKHIENLGLG